MLRSGERIVVPFSSCLHAAHQQCYAVFAEEREALRTKKRLKIIQEACPRCAPIPSKVRRNGDQSRTQVKLQTTGRNWPSTTKPGQACVLSDQRDLFIQPLGTNLTTEIDDKFHCDRSYRAPISRTAGHESDSAILRIEKPRLVGGSGLLKHNSCGNSPVRTYTALLRVLASTSLQVLDSQSTSSILQKETLSASLPSQCALSPSVDHIPVDIVLVWPWTLAQLPEIQFPDVICSLLSQLHRLDRLGIVLYNFGELGSIQLCPIQRIRSIEYYQDALISISQSAASASVRAQYGSQLDVSSAIQCFRERLKRPCLSHMVVVSYQLADLADDWALTRLALHDQNILVHSCHVDHVEHEHTVTMPLPLLELAAGSGIHTYIDSKLNLSSLFREHVEQILCIAHTQVKLVLQIMPVHVVPGIFTITKLLGADSQEISVDGGMVQAAVNTLQFGRERDLLLTFQVADELFLNPDFAVRLEVSMSHKHLAKFNAVTRTQTSISWDLARIDEADPVSSSLVTRRKFGLLVGEMVSRAAQILEKGYDVAIVSRLVTETRDVVRNVMMFDVDSPNSNSTAIDQEHDVVGATATALLDMIDGLTMLLDLLNSETMPRAESYVQFQRRAVQMSLALKKQQPWVQSTSNTRISKYGMSTMI